MAKSLAFLARLPFYFFQAGFSSLAVRFQSLFVKIDPKPERGLALNFFRNGARLRAMRWEEIRPRDIFVNAGVTGGVTCSMNYVTDNAAGGMNHFCVESKSGESNKIKVHNIRELLDLYLPVRKHVDFLTVDCEGMDLKILESFPFEKVRPRVIAVEDFDISGESTVQRYLESQGYHFASLARITKIFVRQ